MLNRQVTKIHLFWNDSAGAHDAQTWAYPGRRLAYTYAEPMNSTIGPDGTSRQVDNVEFRIVVESASGLTYSFTRTVRFSDEPDWTERLG
jgi:hypothetical protein